MFSALSNRLTGILDKLRGRGHLTEQDINIAVREIRIALLEADVALPVVKKFIEDIKEEALGTAIVKSISPGQMIVKIVHDKLVKMLGGVGGEAVRAEITFLGVPSVIMLVGLQGSGKTTTAVKLAFRLREKWKRRVLLVSTDVYRPAAREQLAILGQQISIDCFDAIEERSPIEIARKALTAAKSGGYDAMIVDTAGRLHTNKELMHELSQIQKATLPSEVLLVSDAMIGQESVQIAKNFHECFTLSGVILTKIDGDVRGGAALSMCGVTNCPVKFIGVGERHNELEVFSPERAASRILGMGDVVSLVEKASALMEEGEAQKMAEKLRRGAFNMNDLLVQLKNLRKLGGLSSILSAVPGLGKIASMPNTFDAKVFEKQESMICSMTKQEREEPLKYICSSRKRRIAKGSGHKVEDVNRLLKQYKVMRDLVKKMGKTSDAGIFKLMKNLTGGVH